LLVARGNKREVERYVVEGVEKPEVDLAQHNLQNEGCTSRRRNAAKHVRGGGCHRHVIGFVRPERERERENEALSRLPCFSRSMPTPCRSGSLLWSEEGTPASLRAIPVKSVVSDAVKPNQ
jgi:hypothetical protein